MKIALIGLSNSGKSTLWNALTGEVSGVGDEMATTRELRRGVARQPSQSSAAMPLREGPVEVIDTPPLYPGGSGNEAEWMEALVECNALVQVLRLFTRGWLHIGGPFDRPDPVREINIVDGELLAFDVQRLMNRLDELDSQERLSRRQEGQREALCALLPALEGGQFVRDMGREEHEMCDLTGLSFLTALPMIYVANIDEEVYLGEFGEPVPEELRERLGARESPILPLCARLEADAAVLDPGEGEEFLHQQGLRESAAQRILRELDRSGMMRGPSA